jgi:hypothetical protein
MGPHRRRREGGSGQRESRTCQSGDHELAQHWMFLRPLIGAASSTTRNVPRLRVRLLLPAIGAEQDGCAVAEEGVGNAGRYGRSSGAVVVGVIFASLGCDLLVDPEVLLDCRDALGGLVYFGYGSVAMSVKTTPSSSAPAQK